MSTKTKLQLIKEAAELRMKLVAITLIVADCEDAHCLVGEVETINAIKKILGFDVRKKQL